MSAPLTRGVRQALRRIPVILDEDGYATDSSLCADLGIELREVRTAISILYHQRRTDRIGIYIVAPAPAGLTGTSGRAA